MCDTSCATCHMSPVTCHLSPDTNSHRPSPTVHSRLVPQDRISDLVWAFLEEVPDKTWKKTSFLHHMVVAKLISPKKLVNCRLKLPTILNNKNHKKVCTLHPRNKININK